MDAPSDLDRRFEMVVSEIERACAEAGRPRESVVLVGVIKKQPRESVEAFIQWCHRGGLPAVVGVNYVQEYRGLKPLLSRTPDRVHFIGRLQKNKAKDAVALFDVIETIDSAELARVVNSAAERAGKVQDIFLQVNISSDEHKAGFDCEKVRGFIAHELSRCANLRLCGLMTITRFYEAVEDVRPDFRRLRELRDEIGGAVECAPVLGERTLDLSMGMSHDFTVAIGEGARFVRVGTALFGARPGPTES